MNSAIADPLLAEQEALEAPADRTLVDGPVYHQSRPVDEEGQPLPAKNAGQINGGPHAPRTMVRQVGL